MAAVIGDFPISDPARFHAMIANPQPLQQHHHHHHHPHSQSHSHQQSREPSSSSSSPFRTDTSARPASISRTDSNPNRQAPSSSATTSFSTDDPQDTSVKATAATEEPATVQRRPIDSSQSNNPSLSSTSHIPSPPASSSPAGEPCTSAPNHEKVEAMASEMITSTVTPSHAPASTITTTTTAATSSSTPRRLQQPSPVSDDHELVSSASAPQASRPVIHVRDLAHVKLLAQSDSLPGESSGKLHEASPQQKKYDISAMPIGDVIEMVAALLTKITSTNDLQHDAMQRNATHQQQANTGNDATGSSISPMSHSVLAFHGKNVPAITIHSYLARIHKYCPTTFEVFLSLLVYFDRMTERVNDLVTKSEEARKSAVTQSRPPQRQRMRSDVPMRDTSANEIPDESDSDLADDDDDDDEEDDENTDDDAQMEDSKEKDDARVISRAEEGPSINGPSTYFVVDSFNIHRLIISGVTCSSKFFSDVFYTNSRYAKVGGLPLAELNHLELQFLVLNDFRLAIPVEELEAYATMLVDFYAREVASKS